MTDPARKAHNDTMVMQCNQFFGARVTAIIDDLEHYTDDLVKGFRPRIAQAWRTPKQQAQAVAGGNSEVEWSFHEAMTPTGKPDALAVDLIDDDYPEPVKSQKLWPATFRRYLIILAALAPQFECETGIMFGLEPFEKKALNLALNSSDPFAYLGRLGWDPTHIQPRGISLIAASAGRRPWGR